MSKITKELIDKYASDLLIGLTSEENKMVLDEFDIINEKMDEIANLEGISSIEPMALQDSVDEVALRSDVVSDELTTDEVIANATNKTLDAIVVPKVVE